MAARKSPWQGKTGKKPMTKDQRFLTAAAQFLERRGWNVLVIGTSRVQQQPFERKFNYELVLSFTGSKLSPTDKEKKPNG